MELSNLTRENKFLMLALDQRSSFETLAGTTDKPALIQAKARIITSLKDQFSSVLLDPGYGLPAYPQPTKPIVLCIEKSGYQERAAGRLTELETSVQALKAKGAQAIKLLVYFRPDSQAIEAQLKLAKQVLADCRQHKLPLFLEILTYGNNHQDLILGSLSRFLQAEVEADVFKLEYPGSQEVCQKITQRLNDIPWILLSRGVDFPTFKDYLTQAVAAGCQGFLAGRALWQDYFKLTGKAQTDFLITTLPNRFKEISEIVLKPKA